MDLRHVWTSVNPFHGASHENGETKWWFSGTVRRTGESPARRQLKMGDVRKERRSLPKNLKAYYCNLIITARSSCLMMIMMMLIIIVTFMHFHTLECLQLHLVTILIPVNQLFYLAYGLLIFIIIVCVESVFVYHCNIFFIIIPHQSPSNSILRWIPTSEVKNECSNNPVVWFLCIEGWTPPYLLL